MQNVAIYTGLIVLQARVTQMVGMSVKFCLETKIYNCFTIDEGIQSNLIAKTATGHSVILLSEQTRKLVLKLAAMM